MGEDHKNKNLRANVRGSQMAMTEILAENLTSDNRSSIIKQLHFDL